MVEACIFDLDGVIVDTAHYHYLSWKRLANEFGYALTESDNERLKGVSRMESLEIVLELCGVTLSREHKEILAKKKNGWFNEYVGQMTLGEIFPGVLDLISGMKQAGLSVGLASSSKNARTVLNKLGIHDLFDAFVDGNMIHHTKPHPEIFLTTAKLLGVAPAACVVIEDAEAGVEAALAAGMKCIGVGSPALLRKADKVLKHTSEIKVSTVRELEEVRR